MAEVSRPRSDAALAGSDTEQEPDQLVDRLVAEHCAFIWRLLRRLGLSSADADDATQQVFMIAARKIHRVAPDQARPFLYGAALRVASNARRGLKRRREVLGEPVDAPAPEGEGPEAMTELSRACALLDELLGGLPQQLRRVFVLAEIEQLEVAEIASLECIPIGTAASRLRRARSRFRDLLAAAEHRNPFRSQP
jgi:RNA polymerase sigma-70 factor (ECF subfamily)